MVKILTVLYGITTTYIKESITSLEIKKKLIQKKLLRYSFKVIHIKTLRQRMVNLFRNGIFLLPKIDIPKTTNIEVERITKPINPDALNRNVRIREAVIRTVIPEEAPDINAARNAGASERSAFKKGKTGNIARFPINASIIEATENIAL